MQIIDVKGKQMKGFDDHQDNYGNPGIHDDVFPEDDPTPTMIPVQLSPEEIDTLKHMLSGRMWSLIVAYDPVDRAIKFKVNGLAWSPPLGVALIDLLD